MDNSSPERVPAAEPSLDRETLLNDNLNLVYHVARKLTKGDRGQIEFDELVSAGTMGLIEAVEKFEPSRGLAFSTFAVPRIRGAILDELRRLDSASRTLRRKQRALDQARHELQGHLGRDPSDEELAEALDVDMETLWEWRHDMERTVRVSLDTPTSEEEGNQTTLVDVLSDEDAEAVDADLERSQELALLETEIAQLDEQARTVLGLYYFEELKLREIAEVLGLTVSRISQIRTKALGTLRGRLAGGELEVVG